VRFNLKGKFTHSAAVDNSLKLFAAARDAGVGRVVHVSITNPAEDSPLEYFRGKGILERALRESGLSYAILRPTVLFGGSPRGREDLLVNNIAWALRRLPVFGVFGDGSYRTQPIHVDDLAKLAVEEGRGTENVVVNAIGPETFTYRELVEEIGRLIGKPRRVLSVSPRIGYLVGWFLGKLKGDVMLTWEEVQGLMADLLYVDAPPAGTTKRTDWAREHAETLGVEYASELARRR